MINIPRGESKRASQLYERDARFFIPLLRAVFPPCILCEIIILSHGSDAYYFRIFEENKILNIPPSLLQLISLPLYKCLPPRLNLSLFLSYVFSLGVQISLPTLSGIEDSSFLFPPETYIPTSPYVPIDVFFLFSSF